MAEAKTVIVTGANRGIGFSLVRALLEKGHRVAGWSRKEPGVQHENYIFCEVDVRFPDQVEQALKKTFLKFPEVDVLVNNAGLGYFGKTDEMDVEQWKEMYDVNVHGLFYCTKAVIPGMRNRRSGHIINIASIAGLDGVEEGAGYSGTKFAVRGISKSLYKELRKDRVKVTCVYPGSVNTGFFDNFSGIEANETMLNPDDVAQWLVNIIESPANLVPMELELRPLHVKYRK